MKSARYRSRLLAGDFSALLQRGTRSLEPNERINRRAHRRSHAPSSIIYTSTATLSTTAGSPFYPLRAGRLTGIRANVAGAPSSSDLTFDVLFDGNSIFHTSNKPTVPQSVLFGYRSFQYDRLSWQPDTKVQVQITTIGGATGPLVVEFEYEPEYRR